MRRTSHRFLGALAALLIALTLPHPALAQEVVAQAGPFAMPISSRSVERLSDALKLDADQKALAKSLYAGYRSSFKQAAAAGDAEIHTSDEKFREEGGQDYSKMVKERTRVMRAFVDKASKLEKAYFEDLKAILTPAQAAGFDRAERTRRREVGLKFAFVAGEGIDAFQILHDLKIDRDAIPGLRDEAEQYEVEIDRAMIAKDKMLRNVFDQMEKLEGPETDAKLIEKTLEEFFTSGNRLRDLHRQFVRKASALLPPDKQAAFDREVKKASFPMVYKESATDKSLAAARTITDLSPEQKTELASITEGYTREVDAANTRWAAAIEDKQSKLSGNFMAMMMGGGEEASDDPLKLAREARKALDERTTARVGQLLKAEQKEKLPKIDPDPDTHGREFMPDFDEHDEWDQWKKEDGEDATSQPSPKRDP